MDMGVRTWLEWTWAGRIQTQCGLRGRGRGLLGPGRSLSPQGAWLRKSLVILSDSLPVGPSPFPLLQRPPTWAGQEEPAVGETWGLAQTLGHMLGRREATEERQEAVKREQGLGASVPDRGRSQPIRIEGNLSPSSTLFPSFPWPQVPWLRQASLQVPVRGRSEMEVYLVPSLGSSELNPPGVHAPLTPGSYRASNRNWGTRVTS